MRSRDFVPLDTNDFSSPPPDGLHVIIASVAGSANRSQRAFFFVGNRFLRTDLADTSAGIRIAWRNDSTIALGYTIYKAADAICCPTGGAMIVRYAWTGTRLKALDPIPPHTVRR